MCLLKLVVYFIIVLKGRSLKSPFKFILPINCMNFGFLSVFSSSMVFLWNEKVLRNGKIPTQKRFM